jgi:hypothetical protein
MAGTEMIQCKFCRETHEANVTLRAADNTAVCFGCVYMYGKEMNHEYTENLKGLNQLYNETRY